jgi:hypothetical protein
MLPSIPYLTLVDMYTISAFTFIGVIAICCIIFEKYNVDGTDFEGSFYIAIVLLFFALNGLFIHHASRCRMYERSKMNMDNHAAAALHRNFHQDSPEEEYLVHTAVHPVVANHVHDGSLRAEIQPKEAAGWLFEGVGRVEAVGTAQGGEKRFPDVSGLRARHLENYQK